MTVFETVSIFSMFDRVFPWQKITEEASSFSHVSSTLMALIRFELIPRSFSSSFFKESFLYFCSVDPRLHLIEKLIEVDKVRVGKLFLNLSPNTCLKLHPELISLICWYKCIHIIRYNICLQLVTPPKHKCFVSINLSISCYICSLIIT